MVASPHNRASGSTAKAGRSGMIGGVDVQGIYPATAAVFVVHGVVLRLLVEAWLIDVMIVAPEFSVFVGDLGPEVNESFGQQHGDQRLFSHRVSQDHDGCGHRLDIEIWT
ncbi:hypothetical protein N656DRAFT_403412 [Canariomyces notabilis]|uniref:Uncharacterized protein n=1 Tax=Canariomyces notabilis TaxID=2074819 RepID=A0AAN6TKX8_9PEZI|nr:hypothetical protein N656DRAFT_403412 [Canariomyces arenarius]